MTFYLNTEEQLGILEAIAIQVGREQARLGDESVAMLYDAVRASRRMPATDIIKLLDNWCFEHANCNLIAWLSGGTRDNFLMSSFREYLVSLLSNSTDPIAEVRDRPPINPVEWKRDFIE